VTGELADGFLADGGILSKSRDEGVPRVVEAIHAKLTKSLCFMLSVDAKFRHPPSFINISVSTRRTAGRS
jgi:hypothetical protein